MRKIFTIVLTLFSISCFGQKSQISELWNLYNSRDYPSVITKATALLEEFPKNVELNLMIGRSFTEQQKYTKAIPHLEFAADNDKSNSWKKAWALAYLGNCECMLENYDKAKNALSACINLNATKNATKKAYGISLLFGFDDFYKNWKIKESKNIRFHFQDMSELEMKNYIISREKAFAELNEFFKSSLPRKINYFVWNSREDAKRILGGNLGFAKPFFCVVHSHQKQTRGHELTHVISNYTGKMIRKTGLINEGTAVCFDLSNNNKAKMIANWMKVNKANFNITEIWANWGKYPTELTYPLAGLFIEELISKFGRDKFLNFFTKQTYENAKIIFGNELDTFVQEFENKYNK